MQDALIVLLSYLIGSIPFSLLVGKLGGVDVRKVGSGNPGATNVQRALGWGMGFAALAGDLMKGLIGVALALYFGGDQLIAFCFAAAVVGHCYPIFLKFKGGKGVASAAGGLLLAAPKVFVLLVLIFLGIVVLCRYVSLGSVVVALTLPAALILVYPDRAPLAVAGLFIAALVIYRHRENIKRLRAGNETMIGTPKNT
ncbi:MAG: glycerol-3-phosphate 1-O-acyltransferase PlsY [Solirubrobacterales bacterium]